MGQLLSGPEQRSTRLRRLSHSVQRRFKRARPATHEVPEPVIEPKQSTGAYKQAGTLEEAESVKLDDPQDDHEGPTQAETEPLLADYVSDQEASSQHEPEPDVGGPTRPHGEAGVFENDSAAREEAYLLLLGRLLAIAASMTAASLVPSRASRGELHGAAPESGDTSFLGFVDSLLSGSHSHELSQAMFSGQPGRNFLRMFRFPQDESGLTPVLIMGARAAETQEMEQPEEDLGFPHLPLDRTLSGGIRGGGSTGEDDDEHHSHRSSVISTATEPPESASASESAGTSRPRQSWVIYVVGTAFPQTHEIFSASSLQSDEPSLEDILILESLLSNPNPLQTASKDQLDQAGGLSLATHRDQELTCSICLENYICGDSVRELGCKHSYHQQCVDKWLTGSHNSCPICRDIPC